ncbi:4'-phosphopantetheinyl transferase superfamily protein [Streptomyces sp. NBC_01463]|uniref:4'-phosphopantetheinyl transferase family protein n=1 Tax=unclassified Streptomyces TaxID=2593676 RepID=UPI002555D60A|nr:4'-phosphopantetheinyl transferase family protein [Streptomyces sp. RTGN2]WSU59682.1 4'-phosphopantetheinyl transferase superfamily protein [Streptomyces sp. NBC_01104]
MTGRSQDVLRLWSDVPLGPWERRRAARLPTDGARADYLAAHILVRVCAARLTGEPAHRLELRQTCDECLAPDHGRPFLPEWPELGVSLSHTRGAVAAAAGRGRTGVDIESTADATPVDERVARRVLSAAELRTVDASDDPGRAFLRFWVRKEALIKVGEAAIGTLRHTDVSALADADADRHVLDWASADGRLLAAAVTELRPTLIELPRRPVDTQPNPERTRTHA